MTQPRDEFSHCHGEDHNPDGTDFVSGSLEKKLINMRGVEKKPIEVYPVNKPTHARTKYNLESCLEEPSVGGKYDNSFLY